VEVEEEVNKSLQNRLALLQDEVTAAQQEVRAAEEAKAEAQERVQVKHRVPLYRRYRRYPKLHHTA
jgi:two-component SAPR family response regulator